LWGYNRSLHVLILQRCCVPLTAHALQDALKLTTAILLAVCALPWYPAVFNDRDLFSKAAFAPGSDIKLVRKHMGARMGRVIDIDE
jgi:hypothetical protein